MITIRFTKDMKVPKWQTIKFNNMDDALKVCANLEENGYAYSIHNDQNVDTQVEYKH